MRKTVFAALLISAGCLAMPALAGGGDPYRRGGGHHESANAKAYNQNHNSAHGGTAYGGHAYGGHAYGGQGGTGYGGQGGTGYGGNVENANNAHQSVTVEAQQRNPVSTAYAAPLAVGEDTCMGSSSIGGQGVGFGISFGTSWTDENCQRLKNSRQLAALGYRKASVALLCVNDDVARAMAAAGLPCRVQNGHGYELSTAALADEAPAYAPAPPRVVYAPVVNDHPRFAPRPMPVRHIAPKRHKPKKVRCRMVRQCAH